MKPKQLGDRLREMLLERIIGMTVKEMSDLDGTPQDNVIAALYRGYGFYISGWQKVKANHYVAVWNCVRVPSDAPRPKVEHVRIDDTLAQQAREREERKKRKAKEREKQKAANAKLRELQKQERAKKRAEREAMKKQILDSLPVVEQYVPQRTRWVKTQPWQ